MKNMGKTDRIIRAILGIGLLSLLFILEGNSRYWGLIGLIPLGTAIIGICPLYMPFKFNTLKKK